MISPERIQRLFSRRQAAQEIYKRFALYMQESERVWLWICVISMSGSMVVGIMIGSKL